MHRNVKPDNFMVDADGKALLLECNTSPALLRHGHHLSETLPLLIEEVVQKAVDPLFPQPPSSLANSSQASSPPLPPMPPLNRLEEVDVPRPPIAGFAAQSRLSRPAPVSQPLDARRRRLAGGAGRAAARWLRATASQQHAANEVC